LLRGTLVEELLKLVIARLVNPEQVSDLLRDKVIKDRLTDIPVECVGIDGHATTSTLSLRVAMYATVVDGTQGAARLITLCLAVQREPALAAVEKAGEQVLPGLPPTSELVRAELDL
jgi:hypothetical protein